MHPSTDDRGTADLPWLAEPGSEEHQAWLASERDRLWRFGVAAVLPEGGFGWLDDDGRVDPSRPVEAWVSCRMTHVAALEVPLVVDVGVGDNWEQAH